MHARRFAGVLAAVSAVVALTLLAAAIDEENLSSSGSSILASSESDLTRLYGHHPFAKQPTDKNVFDSLNTKSHGKYKKFVPETNVFADYPKNMDTKAELYKWVIPGHKWHNGPHGRSDDWNVLDNGPVKKYEWHKAKKGVKGRSDDYNVLDGFDYAHSDPAYDSEYEIPY